MILKLIIVKKQNNYICNLLKMRLLSLVFIDFQIIFQYYDGELVNNSIYLKKQGKKEIFNGEKVKEKAVFNIFCISSDLPECIVLIDQCRLCGWERINGCSN